MLRRKREVSYAGILREMPCQEGNKECQGYNHEERQAGYSGCLSRMWHQDVQNREELGLHFLQAFVERLGLYEG